MSHPIKTAILLSQGVCIILLPLCYTLVTYLHPIVLGVIWFCISGLTCFLILLSYKVSVSWSYGFFAILILIYTLCLILLLFDRPSDQVYDNWNWVPFATISNYLSGNGSLLVAFYNLAANVALFIPWGLFLKGHPLSKKNRFLIPILLIMMIECTQFLTHRGSFDVDDLMLNMLGVFIGYSLFPLFTKVVQIR